MVGPQQTYRRRKEAKTCKCYREGFTVKILVGCEQSQVVAKAFRALGHEAYSCDILPCSGGHPEWHIQDKIEHILSRTASRAQDDSVVWHAEYWLRDIRGWDLMIAHPPCQYLSNSGVTWLYNKDGSRNEQRWTDMRRAAAFFKMLLYAPIPHIVIENPIQHKYAREEIGVSWGQQIHPWMFGHMEQKPTCLWLKNVPPLKETNNVHDEMKKLPANQRQRIHYMPPSDHRAQDRAVTYAGIGAAMASQWSVLP